ncbi:MAG: sigma-70 family RNA polymerase sigma factor [Ginsengibacter sp.]
MDLYKKYTDIELLQLLQNGDKKAFIEIYNRYWEQLVDIGYYFTKDKQAVEEIVDDVFIRLWEKPENFQIRSLPDYLGTAVKFGIFKSLLKTRRRQTLFKNYSASVLSTDEEQRIEAKFTEAYVNGIIETLPKKSRLIFKYSRQKGMSIAAIAKEMNMNQKAVEYHITKTLKLLRSLFRIMIFIIITTVIIGIKWHLFSSVVNCQLQDYRLTADNFHVNSVFNFFSPF